MLRPLIAAFSFLLVIASCAGTEILLPKPAEVPAGMDLSGLWQLHDDSKDSVKRTSATLAHVFLETGKSLKITQTADGLFISFDRAIVEEYRFGEHREVTVGPVAADRVSGWEGSSYAIETLTTDGAKLAESYRLENDGQRLSRSISITYENKIQLSVEQLFDRRD